jgi:hypothetical protein
MMTDGSVYGAWESWAEYMSRVQPLAKWAFNEDDRGDASAKVSAPKTSKSEVLRADAQASDMTIGDLREDGHVYPPKMSVAKPYPSSRRALSARTCRICRKFLAATFFAKQAQGFRACCKSCDNARRRPSGRKRGRPRKEQSDKN